MAIKVNCFKDEVLSYVSMTFIIYAIKIAGHGKY